MCSRSRSDAARQTVCADFPLLDAVVDIHTHAHSLQTCTGSLCTSYLVAAAPLGPLCTWYRPTNLQQLLSLKAACADLKLVGGNSEVRGL